MSAVSTGASSVIRSMAFFPIRFAARGLRARGAASVGRVSGEPAPGLKRDAYQFPLNCAGRGRIDDDTAVDDEFARFVRACPLRVAKVVQPIDELAIGERLSAPELERLRKDAWKHQRAGAPCRRSSINRAKDT